VCVPPPQPEITPLRESLPLQDDVWLHLTDGRSLRTSTWLVPQDRRVLLGRPQLDAVATAMAGTAPGTVHLLASASAGTDWHHYLRDWSALGELAARHRLLMLSGDLRRNAFASHIDRPMGWPLHEATSSGAAVRDALLYGAELANFALAEIDAAEVRLRFFDREGEAATRLIARDRWAVAGPA
jgi:alkaline phosphatase D